MSYLSTANFQIIKRNISRLSHTNSTVEFAKMEPAEMLYDELNAENVDVATAVPLLRIRARDLLAEFTRM